MSAAAVEATAWQPNILGSARESTLGTSAWALEIRERPDRELGKALTALAERSGGSSVFFEPPFLNASWHRFGGAPKRLMVLFEEIGEERLPRLAFPFSEESAGFPPVRVQKVFSHPYAPVSLPLMERDDAEEVSARFAGLLAQLPLDGPLMFEDFPAGERQAEALGRALQSAGFSIAIAASRSRAALPSGGAGELHEWLGRKRRRELDRQLRRLGEAGKVEFEVASSFLDVMVRFEEFLLLETRSWKGRRGSSIHVVRKTAAFARQSVGAMARKGCAEILSLRLDGRSIASLIVLKSQGRRYPWKMAFDEAWRSHAPGTQLIMRASSHMLSEPGFEFADSLAAPDSWINRLWPHKMELATLVVGRTPREAESIQAGIQRLRDLKDQVKRVIRR